MTEAEMHADIVNKLRILLPSNAVLHHSPNEGKRGWRSQKWLKASGTRPGWPDIELIYEGKFYGIELKAGTRKVTALQAATHDALFVAGAKVKTCRSLDDVIDTLQGWKIPLNGRVM
jgi:hypothetical protein